MLMIRKYVFMCLQDCKIESVQAIVWVACILELLVGKRAISPLSGTNKTMDIK